MNRQVTQGAPKKLLVQPESQSIATQLYRLLREAIIRGELPPGAALSESEISQQYDTSRQPVREAFIKLKEEGLISILPNRGTFVSKISVASLMEARFIRETLESALVREVANHCDDATEQKLREFIELQKQAAQNDDVDEFLRLDEAFHQYLILSAGNQQAWKIIKNIKSQMSRVRLLCSEDITPSLDIFIKQHTDIVEAICKKDPELAAHSTTEHLQEIVSALPNFAKTLS